MFKSLLFLGLLVAVQLSRVHCQTSWLYVFGRTVENNESFSSSSRLRNSTSKWENRNSMPRAESGFCGAVIEKKIFFFGGTVEDAGGLDVEIDAADVYDSSTDTYKMLEPMPDPRRSAAAAALNGFIYVSGGENNRTVTSSLLRYNPQTDQWSSLKPMNTPRVDHQLVELNGLLYAIGGYMARRLHTDYYDHETNQVEVYNPATDQWSFVNGTHRSHAFFGAAAHEGKIYVYSSSGMEMYDPDTDRWTVLKLYDPTAHYGRTLVSWNGKLWAIGGQYFAPAQNPPSFTNRNNYDVSRAVLSFDPDTGRWTKENNINSHRPFLLAFVVNQ